MAGNPRTRVRREAAGPLDWSARVRPGMLDVQAAAAAPVTPRGVLDELDARRRRSLEASQVATELDDAEGETSLRQRRRDVAELALAVKEQSLMRALTGGGGEAASAQFAEVLREINHANQEQMNRMVELLTRDRRTETDREIGELKGLVQNLGQQLQGALTRPQGDGTDGIVKALDLVSTVRQKLNEDAPAVPASAAGMSHSQVLEQIRLEEEVDLRRSELRERREDRDFAREQARSTALTRRARLATAAGMVDTYAGPVLSAIMGNRVKDLFTANGEADAGQLAATVDPNRKAYQCPTCGAVNWADIHTEEVACPGCGEPVVPFPQLRVIAGHDGSPDAPHHHDHSPDTAG